MKHELRVANCIKQAELRGETEFTMSSANSKTKNMYKYKLVDGKWINIRGRW